MTHGDDRVFNLIAALKPFSLPLEIVEGMVALAISKSTNLVPELPPVDLSNVARVFHKRSLERTEIFGSALVADAAWNMMLMLYADSEDDRPVSVSSACIASGAPATTALRYIEAMIVRGYVVRTSDPSDRRRSNLLLTPRARDAMATLIRSFCVNRPTLP